MSYLDAPSEVIAEISSHFQSRSIRKHELFLREGSVSNEYLFLEEGILRAFATDIDNNEITTAFYHGNNVVFEVASFFNHTPSKENLQAVVDCKGQVISFDQLNHLFHSIPEFREFGRGMLVKGFVALKERTLSLITETAEQRYAHLIESNKDLFQHVALKHIASYLGVTDTSLSRIRREYASK